MAEIVIKAALLAIPITAAIVIPSTYFLYRYMKKKMDSLDYDTKKEGWIDYEKDEDWDNWGKNRNKEKE